MIFKYINWQQEATKHKITLKEGEALLAKVKAVGQEAKSMTKRLHWLKDYTYKFTKNGYWRTLTFVVDLEYFIYNWHTQDDTKNAPDYEAKGPKAIKLLNDSFQARTGKTLRGAFGYVDKGSLISLCVPKPFYYINNLYSNKILKGISNGDFSSNYPSNITGLLPDSRTALELEGEVEPTEEYPFAFYNTGHCAEYKRFDTRTYSKYGKLTQRMTTTNDCTLPKYIGKITKTVLCKASKYTLDTEINALYQAKQAGDADAKLTLNSSIGMMHARLDSERETYRLYHIAAVCIGRANQAMLETALKVGVENILQIVVDGIIYFDDNQLKLTEEKQLGKLVLEVDKADFKMLGINQYLFMKDNKPIKCRVGAFNNDAAKSKEQTFENMVNWRKV